MIELLVGMIIAFLIITPMLAFVVNILNSDVKEQAKTNTEQDLQAAMDYIAQDISQAIHVYNRSEVTTIESMTDDVRPIPMPDNAKPILVFWKRKYENDTVPLDSTRTDGITYCKENPNNCDDTFVMSLVAYYQIDETSTTSVWCEQTPCPSRIARVEISDKPKKLDGDYVDSTLTDLDSDGDVDPGDGYNPDNVINYETASALKKGLGDLPSVQVLVNHIEGFNLDEVTTNNKLAKITIVGNALRRSQSDFSCIEDASTTPPTYKNDPYCPKATARVGARSGYGEKE